MRRLALAFLFCSLISGSSVFGLSVVKGKLNFSATANTSVPITTLNSGVWVIQSDANVYFNPYSGTPATTDFLIPAGQSMDLFPIYFAAGKTISFKAVSGTANIKVIRYE